MSTLVFGEAPDSYTIIGSLFVVGSGIYIVYREQIRKKKLGTRTTLATEPTGIDPS